jgi:hypothetical protein
LGCVPITKINKVGHWGNLSLRRLKPILGDSGGHFTRIYSAGSRRKSHFDGHRRLRRVLVWRDQSALLYSSRQIISNLPAATFAEMLAKNFK